MNAQEKLWQRIEEEADRFIIAHNSDLFHMLALILAYYQVRGTTPKQMIESETLRERIAHVIKESLYTTSEVPHAPKYGSVGRGDRS